jgi:predicted HTH domain antitoxin
MRLFQKCRSRCQRVIVTGASEILDKTRNLRPELLMSRYPSLSFRQAALSSEGLSLSAHASTLG